MSTHDSPSGSTTAEEQVAEHWVDGGDYSFRINGDTIIARNAKGRVLKTVPPKAKKTETYEKLESLRSYLHQHDVQCADTVREWFLKGLPVPVTVIAAVWIDPAWRYYLNDLVISTDDGTVGLLRAASKEHGLQLVDLDGETVDIPYSQETVITIPHPAVMDDVDDWREFAVELGVNQGLDQLFRDLYIKPSDDDGLYAAVQKYEGATYSLASHLVGRSRGGGFAATLNTVSLTVMEDGIETVAMLDVDAWDPLDEAVLYRLTFSRDGHDIALNDVGPIAWSEGIRMCEFVYAGRTVQEKQD